MPSEARGALRVKLRANSEGAALARRSRIPVKLFAFSLSRRRSFSPGIGSIKSSNLMALEQAIMSVDCRSRFAARAAAQSRVADPPGVGPRPQMD